jgi:hypothetical protein
MPSQVQPLKYVSFAWPCFFFKVLPVLHNQKLKFLAVLPPHRLSLFLIHVCPSCFAFMSLNVSPISMSTPAHRTVNPSEVGWQFVPQYYTFVNKQPDRLHQFYTKKSTFIHGTEGDDGKPCLGQQVGRICTRVPSLINRSASSRRKFTRG